MSLRIINNHLNGVLEIEASRFDDDRGFFQELFRADQLAELGITDVFVQDNHSRSTHGVVRGLHYQYNQPMGKLITVIRGQIQLVELDVRANSATYGQHVSINLSDTNHTMVWVPPGFANGFAVLSDLADVVYKCTALYNAEGEGGICPTDPSLGITWQVPQPQLSAKDTTAQTFDTYGHNPRF